MKHFLEQHQTVCLGTSSALCQSVVVGLLMSKVKRIHERPCLFDRDSCKQNIVIYFTRKRATAEDETHTYLSISLLAFSISLAGFICIR